MVVFHFQSRLLFPPKNFLILHVMADINNNNNKCFILIAKTFVFNRGFLKLVLYSSS